ncbi:PAS domain-containing sensor histidine kinase [Mariprofundus sp. KV]|uniref:PAS domain S-box protein n=1 Tax=Mariprofundus sp. KV TaxID=2608715 RepID=UPI0015A32B63
MIQSLRKNIANYIEAYAINEYETLVLNQMDGDISAITVADKNMGEIVGEGSYISGKIRDDNWNIVDYNPENIQHQKLLDDCFYTLSSAIAAEGDGRSLGAVTICSSDRSVRMALQQTIIENLTYAVTISLLLILLLLIAIRQRVLKPISLMVGGLAETDENGIPRKKLKEGGPKEITLLSATINKMMDAVHLREKELQESESRFRRLSQQVPIPLAYVTDGGAIAFINERFTQTFGYTLEDMPTIEHWWGIAYPDESYRKWVQETWSRACQVALERDKDIQPLEYNITCKSGEVRPVEISGVFLGNDLLATLVDLSERKQAEAKVQRYSQALEQSGEAIVITDVDGTIEHINAAYSEITGYSPDEVLGKNPRMLKSGSQNARFYEKMWQTLLKGEIWQGKVINRKKSGEHYPAMLTISPIKDETGKTVNYIGVQQNLEKFEELEAQFHQSQKMEAIGTLVGGIAHDFNNTLAGITGNLYLAKKAAAAIPDVVRRLESVEKLSFSAAATIQQLLTFSRKGIVQMNPISVATFLKETIKLNQVSLPENINLQLQIIDPDLRVKGDINQLQQVLLNLINNAYDAVSESENPMIQVRLAKYIADDHFKDAHEGLIEEEFASLSVIDNGSGIKAEDIDHIFEPFFTTKEQGRGTGLGLAMVYGSVKTHGGVVEVKSTCGKDSGTRVDIYLPLLETELTVALPELNDEVVQGHGETILLVDDNKTVLSIGRDLLEGMGYRVMTAKDGREAVEVYQSHGDKIDMVLLDVVMPRLSGPEALDAIKAINPKVKAMFATGYDKLSTLGRDKSELEERIISKPFTVSVLSQTVREVLEG